MALSDVTAEGMERALMEFDRLGREDFLPRYGFEQVPGYFLVRDGRRYDCKAVVGVAHGYDRPDLGPLRPRDFTAGDAAVVRHLDSLGFDVERPPRNPPLRAGTSLGSDAQSKERRPRKRPTATISTPPPLSQA